MPGATDATNQASHEKREKEVNSLFEYLIFPKHGMFLVSFIGILLLQVGR